MSEQPKPRHDIAETLAVLWCSLMHDRALWPIHGSYRCQICDRSYPVPWAVEHSLQPARLVIQPAKRVVENA